jgi:hypothetical protein
MSAFKGRPKSKDRESIRGLKEKVSRRFRSTAVSAISFRLLLRRSLIKVSRPTRNLTSQVDMKM